MYFLTEISKLLIGCFLIGIATYLFDKYKIIACLVGLFAIAFFTQVTFARPSDCGEAQNLCQQAVGNGLNCQYGRNSDGSCVIPNPPIPGAWISYTGSKCQLNDRSSSETSYSTVQICTIDSYGSTDWKCGSAYWNAEFECKPLVLRCSSPEVKIGTDKWGNDQCACPSGTEAFSLGSFDQSKYTITSKLEELGYQGNCRLEDSGTGSGTGSYKCCVSKLPENTCTAPKWFKAATTGLSQDSLQSLGLKGTCTSKGCCVENDPDAVAQNHPYNPTGKGDCGQDQPFIGATYQGNIYQLNDRLKTLLSSDLNTEADKTLTCDCRGKAVVKSMGGANITVQDYTSGSNSKVLPIAATCDYSNSDPNAPNPQNASQNGTGSMPLPPDKSAPCAANESKVLKCSMEWICQDTSLPVERCKCDGINPTDGTPKCTPDNSPIPNNQPNPNITCTNVSGVMECTDNNPKNTDPNKAKTGTDQCGAGNKKEFVGSYISAPSNNLFACNGNSATSGLTEWCKCVVDTNAPANATTSKDAGNFYCQGGKKYVYNKTSEKFVEAANGDTYGCDFAGGQTSGQTGGTNNSGGLQTEATAQQANSLAQQSNAIAAKGNSIAEKGNATLDQILNALKGTGDGKFDGSDIGNKYGTGLNDGLTKQLADEAPKSGEVSNSLNSLKPLSDIFKTGKCIDPKIESSSAKYATEVLSSMSATFNTGALCEKTEWFRELMSWVLKLYFLYECYLAIVTVFNAITGTKISA